MNIIGIISSPRPNGNTATLVRQALKGAAERSAQTEELYLPAFQIEYCKGCFTCMSQGKCPIRDDFSMIFDKLLAADGIIISSPTYGLAPIACMKALLDRLGMYNAYTSALGGKYVISISSAGAMGAKTVAKNLAGLVANGVFRRGYISGLLAVNAGHAQTCEDQRLLNKAYMLGQKIADDIAGKRRHPLQNLSVRILNKLAVRRAFLRNIMRHKEKEMKAIYRELTERGIIAREESSAR